MAVTSAAGCGTQVDPQHRIRWLVPEIRQHCSTSGSAAIAASKAASTAWFWLDSWMATNEATS